MALTVEALKGLYEKLGGTDFGDVTTIPEAIDKINEVAEPGGGAGLPAVTTDDNGKVLGVVNGAWDKTDAPEGALPAVTSEDEGKVLTVEDGAWKAEYPLEPPVYDNDYKVTLTATLDEQTQQAVLTADKSVAEIYAAAAAGKHCFAVIELAPGTYQRYELYLYSSAQVTFYGVEMDEEGGASLAKPVVIEGAATGVDHDEWTVID